MTLKGSGLKNITVVICGGEGESHGTGPAGIRKTYAAMGNIDREEYPAIEAFP